MGLPIMSEFFHEGLHSAVLDAPERTFLSVLRKQGKAAQAMLSFSHLNLEDILTYWMISNDVHNVGENSGREDYTKLLVILKKIFSKVEMELSEKYVKSLQTMMMKGTSKYPQCAFSIITTNYDVIAEYGIARLGMHARMPFDCKCYGDSSTGMCISNSSEEENDGSTPLVCKLHGSVNWTQADGVVVIDDHMVDVAIRNTERLRPVPAISVKANRMNVGTNSEDPIIVPPTFYKSGPKVPMDKVWQAAYQELATARDLIFIGYSFPSSDTYMKYFIACGLENNVNLEKIIIIDPDVDGVVNRIKKMNFGSDFLDRIVKMPTPWESSGFRLSTGIVIDGGIRESGARI